ncbi:phytase [Rapidithrix thailandica]|uniref:Phytase n=1 Tax=Rapidithrix thailandica TaxID=413964 RepID=A0AAW9S656_9BACT
MNTKQFILMTCLGTSLCACFSKKENTNEQSEKPIEKNTAVEPVLITEKGATDTDDPAFWIHPEDPSKSLIIGTDKGNDTPNSGAVLVYDLEGKLIAEKSVVGLTRVNNVDVAQGVNLGGDTSLDIAVVTERGKNALRVFALPAMDSIDNGGIPVFEGDSLRKPMGVALYQRPTDGAVFAIVSRKEGLSGSYLWQYRLYANPDGNVTGELVRKFGAFEGGKEIEAIAVDGELGYVYYSDEGYGVRKYYADPEQGNEELALFAREGFADDHEGISIYTQAEGKGYILVSDQQDNSFQVFPREGTLQNPHDHPLLKKVKVSTQESDGSEVTSLTLNETFKGGLFVAMSEGGVFHYYRWSDLGIEEKQ